MKLTIREIETKLNALMSFNKDLPVRVQYTIKKNKDKLMEEYKCFEKQRLETLKKYCEVDESGNPKSDENGQAMFKNDEARDSYMKDYSELMEYEQDIQIINFSIALIENINMTAQEFEAISFMINE